MTRRRFRFEVELLDPDNKVEKLETISYGSNPARAFKAALDIVYEELNKSPKGQSYRFKKFTMEAQE